jgi:hypothetical protein
MGSSPLEITIAKVVRTATACKKELTPDREKSFKSAVLNFLRELATELGSVRGAHDLRFYDKQGTLQTDTLIVSIDLQTVLSPEQGIQYKRCTSRSDFTGTAPQWYTLTEDFSSWLFLESIRAGEGGTNASDSLQEENDERRVAGHH